MKELSTEQLQSILDNYSVGKIVDTRILTDTAIKGEKTISLSRYLVETNQGIYIIVFADEEELHNLWWGSDSKRFTAALSKALKLKNAQMLLANKNTITVHKFDLRVSVFAI